jgi:hypothetical protein
MLGSAVNIREHILPFKINNFLLGKLQLPVENNHPNENFKPEINSVRSSISRFFFSALENNKLLTQ